MVTTITCGGGTYIRALARDLGRAAGSAAHLSSLRRTGSGTFIVADAISLDALKAGGVPLQPPLAAVTQMARVSVSPTDVINVRHGRALDASSSEHTGNVALVDDADKLVAIAERVNDGWQPRMVLPHA
jgi:tRNA pseudouridine55 synthase